MRIMLKILKIAHLLALVFTAELINPVSSITSGLMINVDRPKPDPTMSLIGSRRKRYFQELFDLKEKRLMAAYDLMLRKEQLDFESRKSFCEKVLPYCQTRKRLVERKLVKA
ncbi:uncharacterized protein LOC116294901 [Actinia tenebrosa]|uniref:Uncharacterized protein LOC116294901 n=1 Tax=Actinia tenebrosa TaxID=6105 RepID=A0A6P8HSS3_ACTTE|nr:uncharacterized protein LOC116294901 [Actinia tenebrosa]